jgi:acylphosphatase
MAEHENARARALITGRVQGVAFRFETRRAAERIGVSGWVRNRADGSVEAVFEGRRPQVEEILAWCGRGPALARVAGVDVRWEAATGEFEGFFIAH